MTDYFYRAAPPPAARRQPSLNGRPSEPQGRVSSGRIVKLFVGQGHGYIRSDGREVFFHRSDVHEGTSINDFTVGDRVTFELLDDTISGARALRVRRRRPTR